MSDVNNSEMEDELSPGISGADMKYDDESVIWEGGPSQWVNLFSFIWWFALFIAALALSVLWDAGLSDGVEEYISTGVSMVCNIVMGMALLSVLHAYLSVRYEHTTITRNKIKEAKGITRIFRQEKYCELSDISDMKSPAAGLLGLLGLSTLVIETKDDDQPVIHIRAIRERENLISIILPVWRKMRMDRKGYFEN